MQPNILHVIDHADSGGAQIVLRNVIESLRGQFHFTVVVLGKTGEFSLTYKKLGVPVFQLGADRWNPLGFRKLVRLMQHQSTALVHTHLFKSNIIGTLAAKYANRPSILHDHTGVSSQSLQFYFANPAIRAIYLRVYRYVVRQCDRVIVLTESAKLHYVQDRWADSTKITVVPNGIDVAEPEKKKAVARVTLRQELELSNNTRLIAMVGRLEPEKDWSTFVQVAQVVSKLTTEHCKFLVVGSGSEEGKLRHQINEVNLDNVLLLGYRNDIRWILSQTDILLLTSRFEAFSMAVLEAMAAGCAIVATRCNGPESIITNESDGILTDVGDVQALAYQVIRLLRDWSLRQQLVQRAQQKVVTTYMLHETTSRIADIYERTLGS